MQQITPQSAHVGAVVRVYGTGFSATQSQDTVKFNGTAATVSYVGDFVGLGALRARGR